MTRLSSLWESVGEPNQLLPIALQFYEMAKYLVSDDDGLEKVASCTLFELFVHKINSKGAHAHDMGIYNQCGCIGYALTQLVGCLGLAVYSSV